MIAARPGNRRLALGVTAALALLTGVKLLLAWRLPLFGDEAFYWLESRHLAPAYSDLPFLTALLVRAGTALAGDTYLGVRLWFLALGALVPVLVWFLAARLAGTRCAWWAAGAGACVPLAAMLGVLALPDVPLVALGLAGLLALIRAADGRARGWWIAAGLCAALGLCAHYRFAALLIGPAAYFVATRTGRRWLATPWPWAAALVAGSGLLPVLWFNLHHDFAGLAFQFMERHPGGFQAEGWRYLPIQALVTTPLMFAALAAALVVGLRRRRRDAGAGLTVAFSSVLVGGFALAAFFADTERISAHWSLAGYLPLLAWLPAALARLPAWSRWPVPLTGAAGTLLLAGYLALALQPDVVVRMTGAKAFPDNFAGWRRAASVTAGHLVTEPRVVVAGNFMLAAELDFELEAVDRVYSLDHPLNRRHGRARQMAIWGLDEAGLARREAGRPAAIVVEESALKIGDQPAWVRRVCRLFDQVAFTGEVAVGGGRKRFLYFNGTVRPEPSPAPSGAIPSGRCDLPPHAYLIEPRPGSVVAGPKRVHGWAVEDNRGVARVALLVDGRPVAAAARLHRYRDVARFLPGSVDPNHPRVGFAMQWDPSGLAPGWHDLAIRVTTRDGNVRVLENRAIWIQKPE